MTSAETNKTERISPDSGSEEPTAEELAAIEFEVDEDADDMSEVDQLRAEAALNLDRYQRAVADLANYRRRKDQEILRLGRQTRRAVLQNFLPVIDDFERALAAFDGDNTKGDWLEGFRMIERKLWSVLEAEGVRPMEALGERFDPSFHDAVEVEDGVQNPDVVVGEHRRGYFIGDEVMRPAMVKVGQSEGAVTENN